MPIILIDVYQVSITIYDQKAIFKTNEIFTIYYKFQDPLKALVFQKQALLAMKDSDRGEKWLHENTEFKGFGYIWYKPKPSIRLIQNSKRFVDKIRI